MFYIAPYLIYFLYMGQPYIFTVWVLEMLGTVYFSEVN